MSTPRRVQAGEPFRPSASGWNAMADYVRRHQAGETGPGGPGLSGVDPVLTVLVRNDTGGDLPARSVLKPGDPVVSAVTLPHQVQAEPYFAAAAPAAATDPFVVTLEPIKAGAVGRAAVQGVAVVEVSVADAGHDFAAPVASTTARLASATSGPAAVLWKEPGTGNKRAVVLLAGGDDGADGEFDARVSAVSGTEPTATYTIVEVERTAGETWADKAGGRTGTAHRMKSNATPPAIAVGQHVRAKASALTAGEYEITPWGAVTTFAGTVGPYVSTVSTAVSSAATCNADRTITITNTVTTTTTTKSQTLTVGGRDVAGTLPAPA